MREIKFRAYLEGFKEMVYPDSFCFDMGGKRISFQHGGGGTLVTDRFMQFTGLHDKNGKEIYEGDIVSAHNFYFNGNFDNDHYGTYIVEWIDEDIFGFFLTCVDDKDSGLRIEHTSHFDEPCIEVIGNIYEHAHLLKN